MRFQSNILEGLQSFDNVSSGKKFLRRTISSSIYILLVFALIAHASVAFGQPGTGVVDVALANDTVTLTMSLNVDENITDVIPQGIRLHVNPSNSSLLIIPMEKAMQALTPSSHISMLRSEIQTRLIDARLHMWEIQENYTLTVTGVKTDNGAVARWNMAFLSMNMSDSLRIGTTEINNVGREYLLPGMKNLTSFQTIYFINGGKFTKPNLAGNFTSKFSILNLAWIPPVSRWDHQYEPFGSSTWSFTPPVPYYNLTLGVGQRENIFLKSYTAVYSPKLHLTAPPRAQADFTTITYDLSTQTEFAMPIIVGVSVAGLVLSSLMDRRVTRQVRGKRKQ